MTKLKNIFALAAFLLIFICIISVCCPSLGEPLNWIIEQVFMLSKKYFLKDITKKFIIYFSLAILTTGGIIVSKKTEKKIWIWVALIVDILGLLSQIQNFN